MMNDYSIFDIFQNVIDQPVLLFGLIVLATFFLEDLATTAAALIAAQSDINFLLPLSALFVGIVLGDVGLYAIGKYAFHVRFLSRFKDNKKLKKAGEMLDKNLAFAVFVSRFLPGMRLPTYMAVGAYEISFKKFLLIVIFAVGLWSGGLFYLFYTIGEATKDMMGLLQWVGIGFVVFLFVLGPKLFGYFSR